ncbi:conserved hypothetical protein [Sphingomonas guangdongensis]|uniref:SnoaL-like domain-containing protein n=1 Tax=Sphingomonas guangdongensis TaxID=1141890 RepID=A0A285R5U4_9SPHN|nr:SgcJ/EcaC family oxidoreductase [Sphingomonas guangdongensis]SOB87722.1 conserved hypothetical protein [Sphingomonas guangdongensis]
MVFGLTAFLLAGAAPTAAPVTRPEQLADRFVAAWNSHDPASFAPLYTPDAIWVPVAEERTHGRQAIVGEFGKVHGANGWAARSTIARRGEAEVHGVTPDVATVFFHMDFLADGKPLPGFQRAMILVAVHAADGWRISAGQLTKESEPR